MTNNDSKDSKAVDDLLTHLLALTDSNPIAPELPPSTVAENIVAENMVEVAIDKSSRFGLSRIVYQGYKALGDYELPLQQMNILTGTNNAGKSTALSAIRILALAVGIASRKNPESILTQDGYHHGYRVPIKNLGISLENIHTDLDDRDSSVTFSYYNGGELRLCFPTDGGCFLFIGPNSEVSPRTPGEFRRMFATGIIQVPVLGPLEYEEPLLKIETVNAGVTTHRACRHFRNFWYHFPEHFDRFASLLAETWPGMTIGPPELDFGSVEARLYMFCEENRRSRELYWSGFGFQIWCQLLTHVCRATPNDLLVIDEPETYLHPMVQRRLLGVLRKTGAQVVLATHSASIVMAAEENDVIVVDKTSRIASRQKNRTAALASQLGLPGDGNIHATHEALPKSELLKPLSNGAKSESAATSPVKSAGSGQLRSLETTETGQSTVETIKKETPKPSKSPVLEPPLSKPPVVSKFKKRDSYVSVDSLPSNDPRETSSAQVAKTLCQIIDKEGPMLAKRAYEIYLRGCGICRLEVALKHVLNQALTIAIKDGRVVSEDEYGKGGLVYSIVRSTCASPVLVRDRSDRKFEEIPPSELQLVARRLEAQRDFEPRSSTHIKAVLEFYELQIPTSRVQPHFVEVLDRQYPYVDEIIRRESQ